MIDISAYLKASKDGEYSKQGLLQSIINAHYSEIIT